MSRSDLRYLYIGSIAIAAFTLLSIGVSLVLWQSDTFEAGTMYQAGLGILVLTGLGLTALMCLLSSVVTLSNLRDTAVGGRAAAVSTALSLVVATASLAYPAVTTLAFGIFLVSLLILLIVGLSATLSYVARMRLPWNSLLTAMNRYL